MTWRNPEPAFAASRAAGNMAEPKSESARLGSIDGWYSIEGVLFVAASGRAMRVLIPGDTEPIWLPRSHLDPKCFHRVLGRPGRLTMSRWLARKRGYLKG